jgi:hypothetical protein
MFTLRKFCNLKQLNLFKNNFNFNTKNKQIKEELPIDKAILTELTLTTTFGYYIKSKTYRNQQRYFIMAMAAPILLSSGALFINDLVNLTFHPYTIKTNITSLLLISMYIKGLIYKTILELGIEDKVLPLVFLITNNIIWAYVIMNYPLNHFLVCTSYAMFTFFTLCPFRMNKAWSIEMILISLAIAFLFLNTLNNLDKWNETLKNENNIDRVIQLHRLSNDNEFLKHMDEYVKYLQQYDVHLFAKRI